MKSDFNYIANYYGVPAKKGQRVEYTPSDGKVKSGVIIGAKNQYIKIQFDGEVKAKGLYHPTHAIKYL